MDPNGATALCLCDCGTERIFNLRSVRRGRSRSCGCANVERMKTGIRRAHGEADWRAGKRSHEYRVWVDMRYRCGPNFYGRQWYYDRGIKVCGRWDDFEKFLSDMGRCPKGMQLDRIDNDGPYAPENCHWATAKTNVGNRSTTLWIRLGNEEIRLSELAERLGISYLKLYREVRSSTFTKPGASGGTKK